jgi:hypothetical protein
MAVLDHNDGSPVRSGRSRCDSALEAETGRFDVEILFILHQSPENGIYRRALLSTPQIAIPAIAYGAGISLCRAADPAVRQIGNAKGELGMSLACQSRSTSSITGDMARASASTASARANNDAISTGSGRHSANS